MISRRRVKTAAVTAACAALTVVGAASSAMASNSPATATGQIKACYQTSGSLPPLDHITKGACPKGDSTLAWNKTGPQGPAGLATGISASSTTSTPLDGGANNFIPVLTTAAAPVTGTYYISATIMTYVVQGDGVDCILDDGQGVPGAIFADDDPVANSAFETLPLGQEVPLTAGETLQVYCGDYTANSSTEFYDGAVTGTLINSAVGNVTKLGPLTHHPLSPRP